MTQTQEVNGESTREKAGKAERVLKGKTWNRGQEDGESCETEWTCRNKARQLAA